MEIVDLRSGDSLPLESIFDASTAKRSAETEAESGKTHEERVLPFSKLKPIEAMIVSTGYTGYRIKIYNDSNTTAVI